MPKSNSVSSIRTLWENNPDTPISSANLSRLQDITASYLNTDGKEPEFSGLHVEGSILFASPSNPSHLIIKRGTILQIINEAINSEGDPIIPKNSQYRLFDIGLEDIILTWSDTDDTNIDKTSWGSGTNEWFVYICDKDDSVIYNKASTDAYGGGAQILISLNGDYPGGQVPGRPLSFYSSGDTRLMGGFKTSGDTILSDTIWDMASKFNKVKAKVYYILDEYKTGGVEYRQIQLKDLNTNTDNILNNNLTVVGSLTSQNINAQNIDVKNINSTGIINQIGEVGITGDTTVVGKLTSTGLQVNSSSLLVGTVEVDSTFTVKGTNTTLSINPQTQTMVANGAMTHSGSYTLSGDAAINGNLTQTGNANIGSQGKNIIITGSSTINGSVEIDGDLSLVSSGGVKILDVIQDAQQLIFSGLDFTVNSPLNINGGLNINVGSKNISFNSTQDINSSTGTGTYAWTHLGNFKVSGGGRTFTVQENDANKILTINTTSEAIDIDGIVSIIVPNSKTLTIKDHLDSTIFGVNNSSEQTVAINRLLRISQASAGNALDVLGSANISGNLNVGGTLYANISGQVTGGASSWTNPVTLRFIGTDITNSGSAVTFNGDEGIIDVNLQVVNDSHTHDTQYYSKTTIAAGGANIPWANLSSVPVEFLPEIHGNERHTSTYLVGTDVNFNLLTTNNLVTQITNTNNGFSSELARSDHLHDNRYLLKNITNGTDIVFTDTSSLMASNVGGAINTLWGNVKTQYAKLNTTAAFTILTTTQVNSTTATIGTITSNRINTLTGNFQSDLVTPAGVVYSDGLGGTTYQLWVTTAGIPRLNNSFVVTSAQAGVADKAKQFDVPQTLTVSGLGISGSVSGAIGNSTYGSVGIDLTLDKTWITNNIAIGSGLQHSANLLSIDFGTTATTVAAGNHTHGAYALTSDTYTKTEVQGFIQAAMINVVKAFGIPDSESLGSPNLFINPTTGAVITF